MVERNRRYILYQFITIFFLILNSTILENIMPPFILIILIYFVDKDLFTFNTKSKDFSDKKKPKN